MHQPKNSGAKWFKMRQRKRNRSLWTPTNYPNVMDNTLKIKSEVVDGGTKSVPENEDAGKKMTTRDVPPNSNTGQLNAKVKLELDETEGNPPDKKIKIEIKSETTNSNETESKRNNKSSDKPGNVLKRNTIRPKIGYRRARFQGKKNNYEVINTEQNVSDARNVDIEYCLTVTNLPNSWSFMDIKNYIDTQCGPVDEIEMVKSDKSSNGAIRLLYQTENECKAAMNKLSDQNIEGNKLSVAFSVVDLSRHDQQINSPETSTAATNPEPVASQQHSTTVFRQMYPRNDRGCDRQFHHLPRHTDWRHRLRSQSRAHYFDRVRRRTQTQKQRKPWRTDLEMWDIDPKGTYGLKESFLKSLNITPPLDKWVHVSNFRCDKDGLREVLEMAGTVLMCSVFNTAPKYANVMYCHPLEAVQAVSMLHGQNFYGIPLKVVMQRCPSNTVLLAKGLNSVGPGLGAGGKPIRTILTHYHRYVTNQSASINRVAFEDPPTPNENLIKAETYKIRKAEYFNTPSKNDENNTSGVTEKKPEIESDNKSPEAVAKPVDSEVDNVVKVENSNQTKPGPVAEPRCSPVKQPGPQNPQTNNGPKPGLLPKPAWQGPQQDPRKQRPLESGQAWAAPGPARPVSPMQGPRSMGPMQVPRQGLIQGAMSRLISGPMQAPMLRPMQALMPRPMPRAMQGNMPGAMQGHMPGAMQGNMPGAMQGHMPGAMQGHMPGAMQRHMPGAMQGNMPGAMQGNMPGAMQAHMSGAMQGHMPGAMQGNMLGAMQGNMPGAMQGNMPGAMQGHMPGAVQGHMPGPMQGHMPGAMQGNMPGAMQGQIPGAMQGHTPGAMQGHTPGAMQGHTPGTMQGPMPGSIPSPTQAPMQRPIQSPVQSHMQNPMQVVKPKQGSMSQSFNPNQPVQLQLSNLPPTTTFPLLCEKMAACGRVVAIQLTTPGNAVVTFANKMQADGCFQTYNNFCIEGCVIKVKYS